MAGSDRTESARGAAASALISPERFSSREFLRAEMDHLFWRVWQLGCHQDEIPAVGDYVEYEIGDQSILIVRIEASELRAYFNTCPHRGTQLKSGSGNAPKIKCRYHGWCWNLDGTVNDIPFGEQFPSLDPAEIRLRECRVDTWGGFVFVNPDPDGVESLQEFLGPIHDDFARYRFEDMQLLSFRTTRVACNWKTAMDAFVETYHTLAVHPQTLTMVDPGSTRYDAAGWHTRMETPLGVPMPTPRKAVGEDRVLKDLVENLLAIRPDDVELARDLDALKSRGVPVGETAREVFEGVFRKAHRARGLEFPEFPEGSLVIDRGYHLFPNMKLNAFPGSSYSFTIRPDGADPDSCFVDAFVLALRGPEEEPLPRVEREFIEDPKAIDIWGLPMVQDFLNFPFVQRGVHSWGFAGQRLGRGEIAIQRMHEHIDRYLEGGTRTERPA